jgi:integrase
MLAVLRKMEQRGVLDKLKKTRQACRQIFTYAVITGRAEHNPVVDLASTLKAPKQKHFPHLSVEQIPDFLRALNDYSGSVVTRNATRLLCLLGSGQLSSVLLNGLISTSIKGSGISLQSE